jgi:hypothetical protein
MLAIRQRESRVPFAGSIGRRLILLGASDGSEPSTSRETPSSETQSRGALYWQQPSTDRFGARLTASVSIGLLHTNHCVRTAIDHGDINMSQHGVAVHELAVVEAFPSSFLGVMLDDPRKLTLRRSDRSDGFFRHLVAVGTLDRLLQYCLPGRRQEEPLSSVVNHDDRAALVCALTALCVASGDYTAVGGEDGWIVLPPITFLGQWAVIQLDVNAQELGMPAFHVSRDRLAL